MWSALALLGLGLCAASATTLPDLQDLPDLLEPEDPPSVSLLQAGFDHRDGLQLQAAARLVDLEVTAGGEVVEAVKEVEEAELEAEREFLALVRAEAAAAELSALAVRHAHSGFFPTYNLSQTERQMAALAQHAYVTAETGATVSSWQLQAAVNFRAANNSLSRVALYRQGGSCALAFAGVQDADKYGNVTFPPGPEVITLATITQTDMASAQGHQGFLAELRKFFVAPEWNTTFTPALQVCGNITAVGHSLGGAVATLFAALLNASPPGGVLAFPAMTFWDWANKLPGKTPPIIAEIPGARAVVGNLTVGALYTFGAPATTRTQLRNRRDSSGVFPGARFFIVDEKPAPRMDPLPGKALLNFRHPMLRAVLVGDGTFLDYGTTVFAALAPIGSASLYAQNASLSAVGNYASRLLQ